LGSAILYRGVFRAKHFFSNPVDTSVPGVTWVAFRICGTIRVDVYVFASVDSIVRDHFRQTNLFWFVLIPRAGPTGLPYR
jgi:hypothetical protein